MRCVVITDEAGNIVGVSQDLADLLGRTADDLVGQAVASFAAGDVAARHTAFVAAMAAADTHTRQSLLLHSDGSEVPCTVTSQALTTAEGRHFVSVIQPNGWTQRYHQVAQRLVSDLRGLTDLRSSRVSRPAPVRYLRPTPAAGRSVRLPRAADRSG